MEKLRIKAAETKAKQKAHQCKIKDQKDQCHQLSLQLQVLRLSRSEKARMVEKAKAEEKLEYERSKARNQHSFRQRQRRQWSQIRSYRRNQEEIKGERRFQLHQELKSTVRHRREKALQDFIRVNLR